MAATGRGAVNAINNAVKGDYILAVEGGIPTAFGGAACILWTREGQDVTALAAVRDLAPNAKAVISVGTCASFGGIPSGNPNPTGIQSVKAVTGGATINIPGCPAHPDWVVWTIANLLAGSSPKLDSSGRPAALFSKTVHDQCPRRDENWAGTLGQEGFCLRGIGCKGPNTRSDCPTRKWNKGTNWCVGANALCIGCTQSGFPDKFSPFFSAAGALPPGHPQVTGACNDCHNNGNIANGALPPGHPKVAPGSCATCHGSAAGPGGAAKGSARTGSVAGSGKTGTPPPGHPKVAPGTCLSCH
jgi:hydrogenase small subunit